MSSFAELLNEMNKGAGTVGTVDVATPPRRPEQSHSFAELLNEMNGGTLPPTNTTFTAPESTDATVDPQWGMVEDGAGVPNVSRYSDLSPQGAAPAPAEPVLQPASDLPRAQEERPTATGKDYLTVAYDLPRAAEERQSRWVDDVNPEYVPTRDRYLKDMDAETYEQVLATGKRLAEFQKMAKDDKAFYESLSREEKIALKHYQMDVPKSGATEDLMAFGTGVGRSIPGSHLVQKETAAERKLTADNPWMTTGGGVAGNIAGAIAGGGAVAKGITSIPKVGAAIAKSPLLKTAAARTITSGGLSGGQSIGRDEFNEVIANTLQGAGGGLVSVIPEVLLPANSWQLLGQPAMDLAYDYLVDRHLRGNEEAGRSADWWRNELLSLAVSEGFAIKDVASGKTFKAEQAKQRGEIGRTLGAKNEDKGGKGFRSKLRGWLYGKEGHEFEIVDAKTLETRTEKDVKDRIAREFGVKDENGNERDWDEFTGKPEPEGEAAPQNAQNMHEKGGRIDDNEPRATEAPPKEESVNSGDFRGGTEKPETETETPEGEGVGTERLGIREAREKALRGELEVKGGELVPRQNTLPAVAKPNEKRVRFDALPSPEVSDSEIRSLQIAANTEPNGQHFVARVFNWLRDKNVLGNHVNAETGWNVEVNNNSVRSVISHKSRAGKVAVLEAVPDLIKNGVFLETIPKNDKGLITHVFAGKINIKSTVKGEPKTTPYAVSFAVREDMNGRRYYDHSLTRIEEIDRIDDHAEIPAGKSQKRIGAQTEVSVSAGKPAGERTLSNILKENLGVNSQSKKTSASASREIPEEAHTPAYRQRRAAQSMRVELFNMLQASMRAQDNSLDLIRAEAKARDEITRITNDNSNLKNTEAAQFSGTARLLTKLADRINERLEQGDAIYKGAGLDDGVSADDVKNFIRDYSMTFKQFDAYKNDYARSYWELKDAGLDDADPETVEFVRASYEVAREAAVKGPDAARSFAEHYGLDWMLDGMKRVSIDRLPKKRNKATFTIMGETLTAKFDGKANVWRIDGYDKELRKSAKIWVDGNGRTKAKVEPEAREESTPETEPWNYPEATKPKPTPAEAPKPAPEPEAKGGRMPKGERIDPDDIELIGTYTDKRSKETVYQLAYKNRKFDAREIGRTDRYKVFENADEGDKFLFESSWDDMDAGLVKHLTATRGETREIPRHNKVDDVDLGYEDAMATVQYAGFDHAGADYSKGKYSETAKSGTDYDKGEGENYIKGMEKTVREYQESTDENLVNFVQNIKDGAFKDPSTQNHLLGPVSDRAATDISNLTKIDVAGFKHNINGNAVEHIESRHGANGNQDHSMADINDVGRIKYVLDNYDDVHLLYDKDGDIERSFQYRDSRNKPSPMIRYKKQVNGNLYVVEAVPDAAAKKLQVVSAYKEKNKGGQELDDNPKHNVRNDLAPSHTDKISDSGEKVNRENKKSSGDASKGDYAKADAGDDSGGKSGADGEGSGLKPVEFPEMVQVARALIRVANDPNDPKSPVIKEFLRQGAMGMAQRGKDGKGKRIDLLAEVFKDPEVAAKVLAHEIGHIDHEISDGLGSIIQNMKTKISQFLPEDPKAGPNFTKEERAAFKKEAERLLTAEGERLIDEEITRETPFKPEDILNVWNSIDPSKIDPALEDYIKGLDTAQKKAVVLAALKGDVLAGVPTRTETVATGRKIPAPPEPVTPEAIAKKYRELILEEADRRRLLEIAVIKDELEKLSYEWRPFDPGTASAKDLEYRQKSEEQYADAISVLFNDPDLLMQRAPTGFRAIMGWMEAKPELYKEYKAIQERYKMGRDAVQEYRMGRLLDGFDRGREQDRAQGQAKEKAREQDSKRTGADWWTRAKSHFLSRSARLGAIERALRKGGVEVKHDESAVVSMSDRNYAHSAIKEYTATVLNNLGEILGEKNRKGKLIGNGWESKGRWGKIAPRGVERDFTPAEALGVFMAARRMATERAEMANVLDPKSAKEMLDYLKKIVGDANYKKLEKAAERYNEIRQEIIIPELERSGAFGKELLKKLKENDVYATFKVVFDGDAENFAGTYKVVGIHKQNGTLMDIANAFTSTVANDVQLINFAKQNKHKLNTINILKLDDVKAMGYKIEEAEKVHNTYKNLPADHRSMQTVHVSEDGEHKAYNVDKSMANIMSVPTANNGGLMKGLRIFGQFQKDMFINYAPTFHVKNPFRDTWETLMKNPELLSSFTFYRRLFSSKAFREGWAFHSKGELDGTTSKMLRNGALNAGFYNMRSKNTGIFNSDLEKDLGLMPLPAQERKVKSWLKAAADFTANLASPVTKPIGKHIVKPVSDTWSNITGSLEYMTKIAAYEGLKKKHPNWSERELAYHVRRFAGTPDIMDGGDWTPIMKEIFLFSNPNIQGTITTFESFKNHKVATPMLVAADMLAKAPMFLAKTGALAGVAEWILDVQGNIFGFGPNAAQDVEDIYNKTISYYKKKYYVIPTPLKADDGVPYIVTIPRGFFGEFTSTLSYNLLDMITGKKFRSEDYFNAAGDLIPYNPESTQPIIQIVWAYLEWAYGINPEDMYRNKKIIPQNIHGAGKLDEAPYMAGWTAEKMAGSGAVENVKNIIEYATGKNDVKESLLDKVLNFPVLGRIPSQFIRRADGGVDEKKREAKAEQRRQKKQRNAQKERTAWVDSWLGGGESKK